MQKDNPLLELPNVAFCVIGSPTLEARSGMATLAAENVVALSKGEKMPTCVNYEIYED